MALTATDVLTRASDIIQDQTNIKWPQEELLRYLNDGRREVAIVRSDLYATSVAHVLLAGTKQAIPSDGLRFIDGVRNVTSGDAVGKAVRVAEREILDAQRPGWHTEAASVDIKHFMVDERNPKVFYVYPPATAGHKMEIVYLKTPTDIAIGNIGSTQLSEEDVYVGALVDYVCYRAFSKDSEYAGNADRATRHAAAFAATLGVGRKVSLGNTPNQANVGGMPPRQTA